MYVTREFMKADEITKEVIEKKLSYITTLLTENNKWNLTDANVICEEIFGRILNDIFGYELVSVSAEISGNYIAVDLIDYSNRVAFQVTSRKDRRKINDTIEKFQKSSIKDNIDTLNVLILDFLNGHIYNEPHEIRMNNGSIFSFDKNVYDFEKIIQLVTPLYNF